jgi:hypothetical protein
MSAADFVGFPDHQFIKRKTVELRNGSKGFIGVLGVSDGNSDALGSVEDGCEGANPGASQTSTRGIPSSGSMDGGVV